MMADGSGLTLAVFSDASKSRDSDICGWAWSIPKFNLSAVGAIDGYTNTEAEIYAAVMGIQAASEIPNVEVINVGSDCHGVRAWINEIRRRVRKGGSRTSLKHASPDSGGHAFGRPELIKQLTELMGRVDIRLQPVDSAGNPHHLACHTLARKQIPRTGREVPPHVIASAVKERQKCLERVAELTRFIAESAR
jgi:ribonuclease HI